MGTWAKLVMLLAVLAICMPAQGQGETAILVYAKTLKCWRCDFMEIEDDPNYWDCVSENIKGFLILDVVYNERGDEIVDILDAMQVEYGRDREGKWFYWDYEYTDVERLLCDGDIVWIFEEIDVDDSGAPWRGADLLMVRGKKPRMVNIGLGRDQKREVVRQLDGNILWFWYYDWIPLEKRMYTVKLRFQSKWTKWANDGEKSFLGTVSKILEWLQDRHYVGEPFPS